MGWILEINGLKRALSQPKTGKKRVKEEFFKIMNGQFQDILFYFFLGVFTVLLFFKQDFSSHVPGNLLKCDFVTNYICRWIDVKCKQNYKKETGKITKNGGKWAVFQNCSFKRACLFKNRSHLYTGPLVYNSSIFPQSVISWILNAYKQIHIVKMLTNHFTTVSNNFFSSYYWSLRVCLRKHLYFTGTGKRTWC